MSEENNLTKEQLLLRVQELEAELKRKQKYGLYWEDKDEDVVLECKNKYPVVRSVEDRRIRNNETDPVNVLIEGDNYHALQVLKYTHKGKVDVIYIDPPYNTGNKDFIYNDDFISKDDSYRHSTWLSFIKRRLELAKELLTDTGVVFVSIDNNELFDLKFLCDSVFGYNSFVSNIGIEITKTQGMKVRAAQDGSIVKNYEYVLVYSKGNNKKIIKNILYDKVNYFDDHYNLIYKDGELKKIDQLFSNDLIKPFIERYLAFKKTKRFSVKDINTLCVLSEDFKNILYENAATICRLMDCDINLSESELDSIVIGKVENVRGYFLTRTNTSTIQQLAFLSDSIKKSDDFYPEYARCSIRGDLWKGFYSDMMNVEKEGSTEFKNGKKPIRLIKQLIKSVSGKSSTTLDFFAGSGTTGHAVLELNKEDGGNRKFILVTNNGDEKSEHKIAEKITYERLKKVMNGYVNKKGDRVDGLGGNLEYMKCELIEKDIHKDNLQISIANNSVETVALREGVFEKKEVKQPAYTILQGVVQNVTHSTAIYTSIDDSYIDDFKQELEKLSGEKSVYINSLMDYSHVFLDVKNINIKDLPEVK